MVDSSEIGMGIAEGEAGERVVLKVWCCCPCRWMMDGWRRGRRNTDVDADVDADAGLDAMRRASCDAAPREREECIPIGSHQLGVVDWCQYRLEWKELQVGVNMTSERATSEVGLGLLKWPNYDRYEQMLRGRWILVIFRTWSR